MHGMEEQPSVVARALPFPPYKRRRLQSRTYEAIVHIFSLFDQQPHSSPPESSPKAGQVTQEKAVGCSGQNNSLTLDTEEGHVVDDIKKDKAIVEDHSLEKPHNAGDGEGSWRTYEKFMLSILSPSGDGSLPRDLKKVRETEAHVCEVKKSQVIIEKEGEKASTGVVETGVKRKRLTTKARSEKKKAKRRKKRAELDRQSGVKRLKLQPISKPKVVNHCKFYINGKCQQGDACKFSHDTVPLTKCKPCNFLALNKCLKGDDCPYDHELSKYPCNNYKAQGFCPRGDSCLFSHKVSLRKDSPASDLNKFVQEISSLQGSANSGKQPHTGNVCQQSFDRSKSPTPRKLPSFKTVTRQPTRHDAAEVNPPAQAPKGISFLSFGKAQCDNSSKLQQNELPANRGNGAAASEKLQHKNEIGRKPASTVSLFPSSTVIEAQDRNKTGSAQVALCSASLPTSNCDSTVKNPCLQSFPSDRNIPTVSSILQEFLFNGQ